MIKILKSKSFLISMIIATVIAAGMGFLNAMQEKGVMELLCNACFVAGVFVGGFGCLLLAANEGMFDLFGYGISFVTRVHLPFLGIGSGHEKETYADYKERKRAKRKSPAGVLLAGGIFLGLAVIFLVIYLIQNSGSAV